MRAFITGSAGFIGHNVVRILEQQGVECFGIDNRTNYGFVPQDELDYLLRERFKRIRSYSFSQFSKTKSSWSESCSS